MELVWPLTSTYELCLVGAKTRTDFTRTTDVSSTNDPLAFSSASHGIKAILVSDVHCCWINGNTYLVVGLGINYATKELFVTKNGALLGTMGSKVRNLVHLYPTVGIKRLDNKCRVNFGQRPFEFDIVHYLQELDKDEKIKLKWPFKLYSEISTTDFYYYNIDYD